jgi:UTP--glucose-1-phosphate uridylyltransferase
MNYVKPVSKAVIPVAGLGTRMLPATKAIPKELLPIYDRPIIEHVVKEAIDCGINEIIFVTRSGKEAIENHFDANYELEHRLVKDGKNKIFEDIVEIIPDNVKITSVRQAEALGLGHAILCAKHLIKDEPFAVLLPDVLVLEKKKQRINSSFFHLVNAWNKTGIGQVMVEQVDYENVEEYGIIDFNEQNKIPFQTFPLSGLVEKPNRQNAPSNLAILGRYILPAKLLDMLENINPGVGNEIQLTDALSELQAKQGLNAVITDADVYDCGNKLGYLCANLAVGMQDSNIRTNINALFDKLINNDL